MVMSLYKAITRKKMSGGGVRIVLFWFRSCGGEGGGGDGRPLAIGPAIWLKSACPNDRLTVSTPPVSKSMALTAILSRSIFLDRPVAAYRAGTAMAVPHLWGT